MAYKGKMYFAYRPNEKHKDHTHCSKLISDFYDHLTNLATHQEFHMIPYKLRKLLLQGILWLPTPNWVIRFFRFFIRTKSGENFGDMTINGELLFINKHAPHSKVVFDVGAHIGSWAEHALSANPKAQIHCFEPMKKNFGKLIDQPFANQLVCNHFGLSNQIQDLVLFKNSMSLYQREVLDAHSDTHQHSELIQLSTLDDYCKNNKIRQIDLLKIDVEGHDFAVLEGGKEMIDDERILRIQFEYGPFNIYSKTLLKDFFTFFDNRPYALFLILPRGLKRIPKYDHRLENFVYKNFVALHASLDPPTL